MLIDPQPYKDFIKRLQKVREAAKAQASAELNTIADRHLSRCKDNTATGSSPYSPTLGPAWDRSGVIETIGGLQAEVFNPKDYASFYELGHRQEPGRLVFIELRPGESKYGYSAQMAKSGKHKGQWGIWIRLKKPYVKGAFVMTDSEKKAQKELDAAARRIEKIIQRGIG